MIDRFLLMIGAMKSGTTAIFHALSQHPAIAPCSQKEPNFFSHDDVRAQGFDWYRSLWDWSPEEHRWALEASTSYAKMPARPNAALAAHNFPAQFRFLYVVRDPVERIRSQYLHSLSEGWIGRPITQGVAPQALLFSNYGFQLRPYELSFGRDAILVVRYEDFRTDRAGVLRRISEFLGIDTTFAFRDPGPRNSSDLYRKKLFVKMLAERGAAPGAEVLQRILPLDFDAFREKCGVLANSAGHPVGVAAMQEEMRAAYTPTEAQAAEIRGLLRDDLLRFCDAWQLEPWEGLEEARAVSSAA